MIRVLAVLAVCAVTFAQQPFPDPQIGTRPGAFSARSLGLGHTFMTEQDGPAAMMGNPATMAYQVNRWHLELQSDVSRVREIRSYPFYDSFDGILNYNNYATNDHLYSKLDGGMSVRVTKDHVPALVLSVASYSTYRFSYQYHEEVRNRFSSGGVQDRRLGENRIDISGDLRSVTFGAAARASERFSAGAAVSVLSGDYSHLSGTWYADRTLTDTVRQAYRLDYSPDGMPAEFTLGATYRLNQRVLLGARALLPTGDFSFDQTAFDQTSFWALREDPDSGDLRETLVDTTFQRTTGTVSQTYPSRFGIGAQYRPQNEFRPSLYLEGDIVTYSNVADHLDDIFEIRAGVEQSIVPGTPVRFGFVYSSSPDDSDRANSLFTTGIGFVHNRLSGDFGVEIGKLNYTEADLFPQELFDGSNRSNSDQVETSLFRGMVTLSWALN